MSDDNELTLADGTVIDLKTGRPRKQNGAPPGYVAVPTHAEARKEVVRVRKKLADLPELPQRMNIVAAVAAYHMFGLDDHEIAHALGCTTEQVGRIKLTEAFTELMVAMTENIVATQQDDVRMLLQQKAKTAAQRMLDALDDEDSKVAVVAAKDVLDRAGHRPVDIVEHRHRVEGGLTIEYVKRGKHDEMPTLDLNAEDVTDGD